MPLPPTLATVHGGGFVASGPAGHLAVGDLVWFRHAKSGEPFEHTTTVQLLSGSEFVDEVRTYRGHGLAF